MTKTTQLTIVLLSFFLAGLAYLFYHYIFMPHLSEVWTWYGFLIMTIPVWFIYGTHELTFYLYTSHHGIHYKYTLDTPYLLFVVLCILYGLFALSFYKLFGVDIRIIIPVIFLPALSVRLLDHYHTYLPEAHFFALLSTFIVTMIFVLWIQGYGGPDAIFHQLPESCAFIKHGVFGIALYGLLICFTESIPLKIGSFELDAYQIYKSGNFAFILSTLLITFITFYLLVFGGYLKWFMSPLQPLGG